MMPKSRLEAFSDGVLAIVITILVLEMKAPKADTWQSLLPIAPVFGAYVLSFVYLAIYWNNHHYMLHTVKNVGATVLWANLHLLFWLSLIPFATAWLGENHFSATPMGVYGIVLLMAAIAYSILQRAIIKQEGKDSSLAKAVGKDLKGKGSIVLYLIAVLLSFVFHWFSGLIYVLVAIMWLVPDRRIEKALN